MKATILVLMLMVAIVGVASALPTTQAVTDNNTRSVTFNAAGGSGSGHFEWGSSETYLAWATPNKTVSGAWSDYQNGPPMLNGKTYYVRACDSTGCGGTVSWYVPQYTPLNQTYFGSYAVSIMRGGANITETIQIIVLPYTGFLGSPDVSGGVPDGAPANGTTPGATYIWIMILLAVFVFLWRRTGDITISVILVLVFGGLMWGVDGIGLPSESMFIVKGLVTLGLAGIIWAFFTK